MTISFDDLIPQQGQPQPPPLTQQAPALANGGGLSFEDLIPPKPKFASADLEGLDSDQKVNEFLKGVPERDQEEARKAWADAFVAKQRREGYAGRPVLDTISRVARSVPGIGSYLDEADAGLQSAMGNDYGNALAYRRAQDRAIDNTETEKLGTLPIIGDVYRSGIEKAGGTIAGAMAMPWARPFEGAGFVPGALNAGANTAGYEAVSGFGRGEGDFEKRAATAANDVVNSVPTAMMFGGALGKLQRQVAPNSQPQQDFLRAAQEEGVAQHIPQFISSESPLVRGTAGYLAGQPLTGSIVRGAANRGSEALGEAADRVAETASQRGIAAAAAAPDATAASNAAGGMVREAIRDWVTGRSGPTSGGILGRLYDAVDNAMMPYARSSATGAPPPNSTLTQLTATGRLANTLLAQDARAGTNINQRAVSHVMDALTNPQGGMTYAGIKDLRTYVGQLLDGSIVPEAGTPMPALKRLYGALTQDLRTSVQQQSANPNALQLFDRANAAASRVSDIRESLAKIIGKEGDVTPERLVDRLTTMASSKGGADITQLLLARRHAGAEAWNELSSAVIQRMGRGQGPNPGTPGAMDAFSPDRFLTSYGKLSENGRTALFGAASDPIRRSLDNIATISERFRDLRQYQNPSGTGQTLGWTALVGSGITNPLLAVGLIAGNGALSTLLSRGTSARAVSHWSTALYNLSTGQAGEGAFRVATLALAKQIAEQTGQSENDIATGLYKTIGAQ